MIVRPPSTSRPPRSSSWSSSQPWQRWPVVWILLCCCAMTMTLDSTAMAQQEEASISMVVAHGSASNPNNSHNNNKNPNNKNDHQNNNVCASNMTLPENVSSTTDKDNHESAATKTTTTAPEAATTATSTQRPQLASPAVDLLLSTSFLKKPSPAKQLLEAPRQSPISCGLWLAPSTHDPLHKLSLYVGKPYQTDKDEEDEEEEYQQVDFRSEPDPLLLVVDPNLNEYSPWQDYSFAMDALTELLHFETSFLSSVLLPGIGSLVECAHDVVYKKNPFKNDDDEEDDDEDMELPKARPNIRLVVENLQDADSSSATAAAATAVHRSKHATAGSFTYHNNVQYHSTRPLFTGQELFALCNNNEDQDDYDDGTEEDDDDADVPYRTLDWLNQNGICMDATLTVRPSTIPNIGLGAFAKHAVAKGQVVATTPLMYFDRSQMDILAQSYPNNTKFDPYPELTKKQRDVRTYDVLFTDRVIGKQLTLNYCFGDADSTVLFLPFAPVVNFINHSPTTPNVQVRWSTTHPWTVEADAVFQLPLQEFLAEPVDGSLVMEYVALRDIDANEEIFLDYGPAWQEAWNAHEAAWKQQQQQQGEDNSKYVSAAHFAKMCQGADSKDDKNKYVRTLKEQEQNPYPSNLQTVCSFAFNEDEFNDNTDKDEDDSVVTMIYGADNPGCLRPCHIHKRVFDKDDEDEVYYHVQVFNLDHNPNAQSESCGTIPQDKALFVEWLPGAAIWVVDKPYTSDMHLPTAFRREIGLPPGFMPDRWKRADPKPYGDMYPEPLAPGQVAPIRWNNGTHEIVTPNAFRMGLHESVRTVLLEYCNRMGITDMFRHVTVEGNSLPPDTNIFVDLHGQNWFLQRPSSDWWSNLHWLSPGDFESHENYLQALSASGFDDMLKGLGEYLQMDGLVAFHVTFIAVSQSTRGFMHYDVTNTGGKTYNIIIPLLLANETGPELDLAESEEQNTVGRYRYEYDVASLMGDDAYHATSAVDYRTTKEMRMAATVYVSDVNENNVEKIMAEYTQAFPPKDRALLLGWAGRHWKPNDPTKHLPPLGPNHILRKPPILDDIMHNVQAQEPVADKETESQTAA